MNTDIMIVKINKGSHCYSLVAQNMELIPPIFGRKIVEVYLEKKQNWRNYAKYNLPVPVELYFLFQGRWEMLATVIDTLFCK